MFLDKRKNHCIIINSRPAALIKKLWINDFFFGEGYMILHTTN